MGEESEKKEAPQNPSPEPQFWGLENEKKCETPEDASTKSLMLADTCPEPLAQEQEIKDEVEEVEAPAGASGEPSYVGLGNEKEIAGASNELRVAKRKFVKVLRPRSKKKASGAVTKVTEAPQNPIPGSQFLGLENEKDGETTEDASTKSMMLEDGDTKLLAWKQEITKEVEAPTGASGEPPYMELGNQKENAGTSNESRVVKRRIVKVLKARANKNASANVAEVAEREEIKKGILRKDDANSSKEDDSRKESTQNDEVQENAVDLGTAEGKSSGGDPKKSAKSLAEASGKPHSIELENKKGDAETSDKLQTPKRKIVKVLKARTKIVKKSPASSNLNKEKGKATFIKADGEKEIKKKGVMVNDEGNGSKAEHTRNENVANVKGTKKENGGIISKNDSGDVQKNAKEPANNGSEERGAGIQKRKRKMKERENHELDKRVKSSKDKEKLDITEMDHEGEMEEKLGGLIFMCNSKTKPDCLEYGVMGVSMAKKDLVLGVKPGLKLFLYDYDLKLMYGIFKATSCGGIKLEPRAFGGDFPVQVRFKVHLDCLPLSESIFRKGMKESYMTKHKFKTELSAKQVRKLIKLFRPVELRPKELSVSRLTPTRNEDSHLRVQGSRQQSFREKPARDHYADRESRRHPTLAHEREREVLDRELAPQQRAESPRDLYLTEKEYRTYGLRGDRRDPDFSRRVSTPSNRYSQNYGTTRLRRQPLDVTHRDPMNVPREYVRTGPTYMADREYRTYSLDARHELPYQVSPGRPSASAAATRDSDREYHYNAYRLGASSLDAYSHRASREDIASGSLYRDDRQEAYTGDTDRLRRREIGRDESHLRYVDDRARPYRIVESDASNLPVSSRYSFAGPRI